MQQNNKTLNDIIEIYDNLLSSCSALAEKVDEKYGAHIECRIGCGECCILKTVFPVEAWNIAKHIKNNPLTSDFQRKPAECFFLKDDQCLIYRVRPVICRTHGYPVFFDGKIDFCPKNFTKLHSVDSEYILNLDALNNSLATINRWFLGFFPDNEFEERIKMEDIMKLSTRKDI